jgi:hypothetical protein
MEKAVVLDVVFVLLLAAAIVLYAIPRMNATLAPWYNPVVTAQEVEAAEWVQRNVQPKQLFSGDLFACEMLTAVARQVCSVGGAWELADNANQRFYDNERAYVTDDSAEAHALLKRYGIRYVFVSGRSAFYGYGWKQPEARKFRDAPRFAPIYSNRDVEIFEVLG